MTNTITVRREGCTAEIITHLTARDALRGLRRETRSSGGAVWATVAGRTVLVCAGIVKVVR